MWTQIDQSISTFRMLMFSAVLDIEVTVLRSNLREEMEVAKIPFLC
jgi:hypothetical protein